MRRTDRPTFKRPPHSVALAALVLVLGGLLAPTRAAAYEPRHVFITNRGGGNIVELNEAFEYQRVWFDTTVDGAPLDTPNGMAFTPDGSLFVADTFNDRIIAFDSAGVFVRAFSTTRLGGSIESLYFDADGVMFASANPGLGVVARFTQAGGDLPDVVRDDTFLNLGNINLTAAGRVVVSDFSGMSRGIRELDPVTGDVVHTYGTDLGRQEDVMIDGADRVFVSHLDGNEVVVFGPAPDREELFRFGAPSDALLPLDRPTGIALTHDCYILVASVANGAVFIFRHHGAEPPTFERMLQPGVDIPPSAMLTAAESIAISALGLPGSFDEFADQVPSCEAAPPAPDGGLPHDAGTADDAGADAGRRDAAVDPSTVGEPSGCGCELARANATGAPRVGVAGFVLVLVLFRLRGSRLGWRRV